MARFVIPNNKKRSRLPIYVASTLALFLTFAAITSGRSPSPSSTTETLIHDKATHDHSSISPIVHHHAAADDDDEDTYDQQHEQVDDGEIDDKKKELCRHSNDRIPSPAEVIETARTALLHDCLEPDFKAWKKHRLRRRKRKLYTLDDVKATKDTFKDISDVVAWVRIKNNTFTLLDRDDSCDIDDCNPQLIEVVNALQRGLATGKLRSPDVEFIINVLDEAICPTVDEFPDDPVCKAPVLSLNRRIGQFKDVLVPGFLTVPQPVDKDKETAWSAKLPIAFFRGTPFCNDVEHRIGGDGGRLVNCSRLLLSELSQQHPDKLNVTLSEDFEYEGRTWKGWIGPYFTPQQHAHFQMVLNLDGFAASYRLGMLLGLNSVVLKQESVFEEYYYRALQRCVHYLSIWRRSEDDVLDVVEKVVQNGAVAQQIAANGQAFGLTFLSEDARLQYWESVLWKYAALFDGGGGGGDRD